MRTINFWARWKNEDVYIWVFSELCTNWKTHDSRSSLKCESNGENLNNILSISNFILLDSIHIHLYVWRVAGLPFCFHTEMLGDIYCPKRAFKCVPARKEYWKRSTLNWQCNESMGSETRNAKAHVHFHRSLRKGMYCLERVNFGAGLN